jgi:hypothetical protein
VEALKAGTQAKAFAYLEGKESRKAETPRELEREYEKRIAATATEGLLQG